MADQRRPAQRPPERDDELAGQTEREVEAAHPRPRGAQQALETFEVGDPVDPFDDQSGFVERARPLR